MFCVQTFVQVKLIFKDVLNLGADSGRHGPLLLWTEHSLKYEQIVVLV